MKTLKEISEQIQEELLMLFDLYGYTDDGMADKACQIVIDNIKQGEGA